MIADLCNFLGQSIPFFLCLFSKVCNLDTVNSPYEKYSWCNDVCNRFNQTKKKEEKRTYLCSKSRCFSTRKLSKNIFQAWRNFNQSAWIIRCLIQKIEKKGLIPQNQWSPIHRLTQKWIYACARVCAHTNTNTDGEGGRLHTSCLPFYLISRVDDTLYLLSCLPVQTIYKIWAGNFITKTDIYLHKIRWRPPSHQVFFSLQCPSLSHKYISCLRACFFWFNVVDCSTRLLISERNSIIVIYYSTTPPNLTFFLKNKWRG